MFLFYLRFLQSVLISSEILVLQNHSMYSAAPPLRNLLQKFSYLNVRGSVGNVYKKLVILLSKTPNSKKKYLVTLAFVVLHSMNAKLKWKIAETSWEWKLRESLIPLTKQGKQLLLWVFDSAKWVGLPRTNHFSAQSVPRLLEFLWRFY